MRPWIVAARPRTLPAAVVPVAVGSATAAADGVFDARAFLLALLGALGIQVAANFANDVSDAARQADPADRLGPPRMVATGEISPRKMWWATWLSIGVAGVCGVALAVLAGPVVLVIGAASVVALLGYVGGPFPYGYRGWGELFVFVFFGLVATTASRYIHDGRVPLQTWMVAVPVGLGATAILVINNLRDLETDARVGKRTLAVIIGERATRRLYGVLVLLAFAVIGIAVAARVISRWGLVVMIALPYAWHLIVAVQKRERRTLPPLLAATARLHLVFGLLLAVALVWG